MAFVNLGLVPDTGGSYLLVKQLGPKRAWISVRPAGR